MKNEVDSLRTRLAEIQIQPLVACEQSHARGRSCRRGSFGILRWNSTHPEATVKLVILGPEPEPTVPADLGSS